MARWADCGVAARAAMTQLAPFPPQRRTRRWCSPARPRRSHSPSKELCSMVSVEIVSEAGAKAEVNTVGDIAIEPASKPTPSLGNAQLRIYLALAFGIICIALSAIFTRLSGVPGTVSAFYRIAITVIALAPLFAREAVRREVPADRRIWLFAAAAGVFFALDLALWNTSLFLTTAADATLPGNDAPIIVGLCALLVFRERLRPAYWLGLALALVGMGIIVGRGGLLPTSLSAGEALALSAGVAYALYLVLTQRVRARMNTLPSLWIPGLAGAIVLLAVNLAADQPLWGFSTLACIMLLLLRLISHAAGR